MKNKDLKKKIEEKLLLANKNQSIVYFPADKLSNSQLEVAKKLQQRMAKKEVKL